MAEAQVRLRPITEADLPDYVRWLNDPEVARFLVRETEGLTLEQEREWFTRISSPEARDRHWAIEAEGRHVGNCALRPVPTGTTASFGITIGDKNYWGKGYGTSAVREALRRGFREMGLRRIQLHVRADNLRAIRCYETCGFQHEGLLRQTVFKHGQYLDLLNMGILREEWEEINRPPSEEAGLRIRIFRLSDYEQVFALWKAVGFQGWSLLTKEQVLKKLRRDPDLFLVACLRGQVVGTVMGSWDGFRGWTHNVAVHPSHQRQGIGHSLMSELEKRLWDKGARVLNLHYFNESTWVSAVALECTGHSRPMCTT